MTMGRRSWRICAYIVDATSCKPGSPEYVLLPIPRIAKAPSSPPTRHEFVSVYIFLRLLVFRMAVCADTTPMARSTRRERNGLTAGPAAALAPFPCTLL